MVSYSTNFLHFCKISTVQTWYRLEWWYDNLKCILSVIDSFLLQGLLEFYLTSLFMIAFIAFMIFEQKKMNYLKSNVLYFVILLYINACGHIRKVLNESTRLATLKKIFVSAILLQSHLSNMEGSGKELLHYKIIPFLLASNTTFYEGKFHAAL